LPGFNAAPSCGGLVPSAELFSPPARSGWEGRGTISFTLLGKILLGLFATFLSA